MPRNVLYQEPPYRSGTAAQWLAANPTLALRELGVETDGEQRRKRGDGVTPWATLPYLIPRALMGNGPPAASFGGVHDTYSDLTNLVLYPPKTVSGWGTPVSLVGPQGAPGQKGDTGSQGAPGQSITGPAGKDGVDGQPGAVGVNWRAAYSASTAYGVRDAVSYQGSSYYCTVATTGNPPTNASFWTPLAIRGSDGSNGSNGAQGPAGASVTGPQGPVGPTGPAGPDAYGGTFAITLPLLAVGGSASVTITVTGAAVGMVAVINTTDTSLLNVLNDLRAYVSAANTVTVLVKAGVAIAAGTKTVYVRVLR